MLRILAIAPNEGLALSIREVSQHRSNIGTVIIAKVCGKECQSIPEESYDLILFPWRHRKTSQRKAVKNPS